MSPQAGHAAFDELLLEHGPALRRLAAAYEADVHEREDLLQEIAFAIWRALPEFRGECSARTFVYRIAHNRAITHRLAVQRRRHVIELSDADTDVADTRPDAASQLETSEQRATLIDSVRSLTPALRQTMILSLEGLSHAEIAEVLGTTPATVAVRLTRARSALAELLQHSERDATR
jgi:RNA polymerase sigma factor (sigma-70 family)